MKTIKQPKPAQTTTQNIRSKRITKNKQKKPPDQNIQSRIHKINPNSKKRESKDVNINNNNSSNRK